VEKLRFSFSQAVDISPLAFLFFQSGFSFIIKLVKIYFLQLLGKNTFIYSSLVFALKIDNITGEIQHTIFFFSK